MSARDIALISLFAALTAIGAFLSIPVGTIPVTMQSLFSMLSGVILGARRGAFSQLLYVLLGIIGLPVFAGCMGGIACLFGPTGGYILGFVGCAFFSGLVSGGYENGAGIRVLLALLTGIIVLYICGILGIMLVLHIDFKKAVAIGIFPFIPGDLIKLVAAFFIIRAINPLIKCELF